MINVYDEVLAAEARIRPHIRRTPLEYAFDLSGAQQVYLKLENLQATGSFKLRGALNKLLALDEAERRRGLITASTGNHGLAVAHALTAVGARGAIVLPENAAPAKIAMLRRYDVVLHFHGQDGVEAEREARRMSEAEGRVYVSPYNDPHVIGGQGTAAVEVLRELETVDSILVSVGGGGFIAGVAGYVKTLHPGVEVIGCLPRHSPVMYESIRAGRVVDVPVQPTLSDGTAGGIEADALTFALCQAYVDDWLLVEEAQIRQGMRRIFEQHRLVIEGSAGVTVAAFLHHQERFAGKTVVLILCGGNVDVEIFKRLIC
jgi:threonine dehydratase